jgi:hypothetical protein
VAVVIEGRHLCMEMRGVRKSGVFETRALRGALARPEWAGMPLLGRGGVGPRRSRAVGARRPAGKRRGSRA